MMAGNGYDVYVGSCLLPVTPEKISMKINGCNRTVSLISEGEVNILKKAGLTDIELECEIPQAEYPYATYVSGFRDAGYFLGIFEGLKTGRRPFQFIVCRHALSGRRLLNTNIRVSLEDYKVTEDAKDGFDFRVKLAMKQWRDYGTRTVSIQIAASRTRVSVEPQRETNASPLPSAPQTYTVVKGDSLCAIARRFYGCSSRYGVIYDANRGVIGGNPNRIYPGQVLTIPAE